MKQTITITGNIPVKKNSYRIGDKNLYKPKKVTDFEEDIAKELTVQKIKAVPDDAVMTFSGVFYIKKEKDLDGMVTTVFDALQDGGMFKDDKMIRCIEDTVKIIDKKDVAYITISY